MPTRKVEIEDTLQENADGAIEEVKEALLEFLNDNPDTTDLPCLNNDLDYSGRIHEIIDGAVPIYTSEIEDTWYLHSGELEEAYENHGFGENPRENNGATAIYCYISDEVTEWYRNEAEEIFDEWREKQDAKTEKPEEEEPEEE